MGEVDRLVLIGFSGSGKSTVARLVSQQLGWDLLDTDAAIEASAGQTVAELFAEHGEAHFRSLEREALIAGLRRERVVIATGGGSVVDPALWTVECLRSEATLVVALDVLPETTLARLTSQQTHDGRAVERPLLMGPDPITTATTLKERRQAVYDRADITLVADNAPAEAVADEVVRLVDRESAATTPVVLSATSGSSSITIAPGALLQLAARVSEVWPSARRAWIITDDRVGPLHAPQVQDTLADSRLGVLLLTLPHGESSKSLTGAGIAYDWLLRGGVERGDIIVALGGGVIGDLAGFVAATCLRGIGLAQVPTSLLAMVDSSVGGKTGINHEAGKNLIGAFYQPPIVIIDPSLLTTLPSRELTTGWAEIIKHALIQRSTPGGERGDLWRFLQRNAERLLALQEPALSYLIRRNVLLKAAVVEADERESGLRAFLNFGHTTGHAIEAAGYRYLHGEAVAVGMRAAAIIGEAAGTCGADKVRGLDALLTRFGLPLVATADPERIRLLIESDKKRTHGRQRWILPLQGGGVTVRDDIDDGLVRHAIDQVTSTTRD